MKISLREKALYFLIFLFAFFSFAGSHAGFLFLENYIKLPGGTFRLLILFSLIGFFSFCKYKRFSVFEVLFLCFSFFYIQRIFVDYLLDSNYYTSPISVLINFLLGGLIPIIVLGKIDFKEQYYEVLVKGFMWSGICFGIAVLIYYGQYIGEVSRLSSLTTGDDTIMNPLDLSYMSSMTIGVSLMYFKNKLNLKNVFFILLIILCSIPPFFLGASRGAVVSLFFPFIFMWLSRPTIKKTFKGIILVLIVIYIGFELSDQFESNLIDRLTSISSGKSSVNEKEDRMFIWKNSLNNQFMKNPIFGDGLKTKDIESYPHNLFVEALQTTGILGGIPMIVLMIACFRKSFMIFRYYPQYSWIATFFLLCFIQSMFSFSIYSNKWIWISVGLLASLKFTNPIIHTIKLNK